MDTVNIEEVDRHHVIYGWQQQSFRPSIFVEHSDHIYFWDQYKKRYTDLASSQVNVNVGYNHPKILEAMRRQMEKMVYIAPMFATEPRTRLAQLIAERTPGNLNYTFFSNSGSEAVENAIKIARAVTGRSKIYSAWQSYHGATAGASAISGDPRRHFVEPNMPATAKFHGATCYRCPFGQSSPPDCRFACLASLRNQIIYDGPETIAAIVIEPIAGTSGLFVWPMEFVQGIRELCNEHGILLIADETMSGWGRTGEWFACGHYRIIPDIITTAKGLTSGYIPLGATILSSALQNHFHDKVFVGGLTNEGHALACATGIANIEVYEEENLISRSRDLGGYLIEQLHNLKRKHPIVGDVRGKGLFSCIELQSKQGSQVPIAGYRDRSRNISQEIMKLSMERGLHIIAKWDYVFIAPPLVINKHEIDESLSILDEVLKCIGDRVD